MNNPKLKQEKIAALANWCNATNELTQIFIRRYFVDDEIDLGDVEWYWVADRVGEVLVVNDYFFDFGRIVDALEYDATPDQLFDYQDWELECAMNKKTVGVNFKNSLTLGMHYVKMKAKAEDKY